MKEKKKYVIIVIVMIAMCMTIIYHAYSRNSFSVTQMNMQQLDETEKENTISVENITDHKKVEQTFEAKYDQLEKITVAFATALERKSNEYYPRYETTATITISETQTEHIIAKKTVKNFDFWIMKDGKFIPTQECIIPFERQQNSKGKQYTILIEYNIQDDLENVFLPIYYPEMQQQEATLYFEEDSQNGILKMQDSYYMPAKEIWFYAVLFIALIIILGTIFYLNKRKELTPEKTFLAIIPIMALLMFTFTPMGFAHDEQTHFYRGYEISQGIWTVPLKEGKSNSYLPKQVIQISQDTIDQTKTKKIETITDAVYSPVQFIPSVIGIKLADIFSNQAIILAYVGRITNMILCITLLYFAIKMIPFGKKVLLIFMMIPICIEGISSLSPDGITIAIIFFFIAYVLKLAFDENTMVKKKDIACLVLLSVIISQCKITYLPIVGLLLLIPYKKFKNNNQKNILIVLTWTLSIVASLAWLSVAGSYLVQFNGGISQINKESFLGNPLSFIGNMFFTMSKNMETYIVSSYGGSVLMGELVTYSIFPFLLCLLSVGVAAGDEKLKNKFTSFQKVIMILVMLAVIGLICISEFLTWTMPQTITISGIQGRYFIPILPILFLLIGNSKFKNLYSQTDTLKTIGTVGLLMMYYVISSIAIYIV